MNGLVKTGAMLCWQPRGCVTVVDLIVLDVWSFELDAYVLNASVLVGFVAAVEAWFSPMLRR